MFEIYKIGVKGKVYVQIGFSNSGFKEAMVNDCNTNFCIITAVFKKKYKNFVKRISKAKFFNKPFITFMNTTVNVKGDDVLLNDEGLLRWDMLDEGVCC